METEKPMLPNIIALLSQAVTEKHCVAIRYRDQRQVRVIEPHAIYSNDRGELVVDAYQTRGFSESGRPTPFWRPFRLKQIAAASVLQEIFKPRMAEGFSGDKSKYKSGLVAMVQDSRPAFTYPTRHEEMGPFLHERLRR